MQHSVETSTAARLIVCERSGRWAVALRRELAGAGVVLAELRHCWATLHLPAGCQAERLLPPDTAPQLRLLPDDPLGLKRFHLRSGQKIQFDAPDQTRSAPTSNVKD
jgi:hypothetical protein